MRRWRCVILGALPGGEGHPAPGRIKLNSRLNPNSSGLAQAAASTWTADPQRIRCVLPIPDQGKHNRGLRGGAIYCRALQA